MAAIGPTLPSAASAGHGSYLGISCRSADAAHTRDPRITTIGQPL